MKLIDKSAVLAEIERRIKKFRELKDIESIVKTNTYKGLFTFFNSLEVKEVDLEHEVEFYWKQCDVTWCRDAYSMTHIRSMLSDIAKHFFELGVNASNPIAEENLESFVRQVIDLDIEAGEHYNNIIKEERKENGGSDLMIYLLCGTIDAKELCIQYVLNKLKAKKGE